MNKKEVSSRAVLFTVQGALIAAIYVVLTVPFAPIAFGPIQFRISEALVILPYFTPAAVPGVFIGCLISNLLGSGVVLDIVLGSLATLIGAVCSYLLRKHKFLVCVPPILSNVLIIPWVLRVAYGAPDAIWWMMVTVGIGEVLAVGVLGNALLVLLEKYRVMIFAQRKV
ncbi:MAG: QueT transporter family protein [Lachnospiraceae bacterium]|nr:QueT transporter family protein [Lachnospiraceae bacterium]